MNKHTPGPWEVRERFYIGRKGKLSLAEVICGDVPAEDTEQHEANARLIAAAPELLAALVITRGQWIHSVHAEVCLAAIAKAEGVSE